MSETEEEPDGPRYPEFTLSSALYTDILEQEFANVIKPTSCFVFSVSLPFQIPVPNGTCFRLAFYNIASAHLFEKFETSEHEAVVPGGLMKVGQMRTRVEMAAFFSETKEIPEMNSLDDLSEDAYSFLYSHFSHLLNRLNCYVYGYRLLFEDSKTHTLSPEQFFQVFLARMEVPSFEVRFSGPFVVSGNPANYEHIMFNIPEVFVPEVEMVGAALNRNPGPFTSAFMSYAESRRFLYRGDTKEATIHLGIASEALLNGVFRHIRLAAGETEESIKAELETLAFISRVTKYISHELGGSWDLSEESNAIPARWKRAVYDLRNRVVHGAYLPTLEESWKCFVTFVEFGDFIRERIRLRQRSLRAAHEELSRFPPLFVHGEEGEPTFDVS